MKTTLVIASNNQHKIAEIKTLLNGYFDVILSLAEADINCNPDENGTTFMQNALIKVNEVAKHTTHAVIADDTGLCVNALNGAPGVKSARYAGNHDNAKNRDKLLYELFNKTDKSAYFATAVALRYPNGEIITAEGSVEGYIISQEKGSNGFGYDSIFYCTDLGKTFGEASEEEKNSVSHRARALNNLLSKINTNLRK